MPLSSLLLVGGGALAGLSLGLVGYWLILRSNQRHAKGLLVAAERDAAQVRARAKDDAEKNKAAALVEGRMGNIRLQEGADKEAARRREEMDRAERRLEERERAAGRRSEDLDRQAKSVTDRQSDLGKKEFALESRSKEVDALVHEQRARLERIAGLTLEEARKEFFQRVEDEARAQAAAIGRDLDDDSAGRGRAHSGDDSGRGCPAE
jgi:ribonucrease Y